MKVTGPLVLSLPQVSDTERLGEALARVCAAPCMIALEGDLGAGKTTLARGFLRTLGWHQAVKSPTYTLVEPYEDLPTPVYHFDLYRLEDPREIEFLGLVDYLSNRAVHLIEWPERAGKRLAGFDLRIRLEYAGASRRASIGGLSANGQAALERLDFATLHKEVGADP